MQIKDIVIPYKSSNADFKLFCLGDIHAGTVHCVEDEVKAKVAQIAKAKNAYWIGMGDYAEFITPRDKRFDPSQRSIAEWVKTDNIGHCQEEWVYELFKPIKKKCIGLLYGNHENSIRVYNSENVQQNICDRLEVDNLGFSCFIRLFFRRENSNETHIVKGAFTHGSGFAITKGAKLNKLRRFMNDFEAHIYGYAHMHDLIRDEKPYMTTTNQSFEQSKIKAVESVGSVTGSWFRTYTQGVIASYGEQKAYPPTVIGCPVFEINASTGQCDVKRSK